MIMKNKFIEMLGEYMLTLQENDTYKHYFNSINLEKIEKHFYLSNKERGLGFVFNEKYILCAIHFHFKEENGYCCYSDELPFEIGFKDNFDLVQKKIKKDDFESGGGDILPFIGKSNLWRKYFFENFYLHIEIGDEDNIVLITLGIRESPQLAQV
jgi:hypothetical protein